MTRFIASKRIPLINWLLSVTVAQGSRPHRTDSLSRQLFGLLLLLGVKQLLNPKLDVPNAAVQEQSILLEQQI